MGSLKLLHAGLVGVLFTFPLSVGAQSHGAAAGQASIYCCEVGGQPVCGDILPAACYGRAYREVSAQGRTRRQVQAPVSDEEYARKVNAERHAKEAESETLRKRRLEQALLETYASIADLDARRDRELADLDDTLEKLRAHEKELLDEQKKVDKEIDAFKGQGVPRALQNQSQSLATKQADQQALIDAKAKERAAVSQKFAEDRQRYLELQKSTGGK